MASITSLRPYSCKRVGFLLCAIMFQAPRPIFELIPEGHRPVSPAWDRLEPVPSEAAMQAVSYAGTKRNNGGWDLPIAISEPPKPDWHDDKAKKELFGIRLGKGDRPMDAALLVFDNKQSDALWALAHWLRDPVVVEMRESVENEINLLDKDQLSAKLLRFADEKSQSGIPIHESKDRLAAYKLYAEIQGMMPKNGIDLSNKTFVNNEMKITFVEAEQEKEQQKVIQHRENVSDLDNALPVNLKLVG